MYRSPGLSVHRDTVTSEKQFSWQQVCGTTVSVKKKKKREGELDHHGFRRRNNRCSWLSHPRNLTARVNLERTGVAGACEVEKEFLLSYGRPEQIEMLVERKQGLLHFF